MSDHHYLPITRNSRVIEVIVSPGAPEEPQEGLVAAALDIEGINFSIVWENETKPSYGPVPEGGRGFYHDSNGTRLNREEVLEILPGAA